MVEMNEKASVACILKKGTPPHSFQWYKGISDVSESKSIKIQTLGDVSIITIDPVSASDSGNYTCAVTNSFGKDKYSATLVVKGK